MDKAVESQNNMQVEQSSNFKQQEYFSALRNHQHFDVLFSKAEKYWFESLSQEGFKLPLYLVADFGMLLAEPDSTLDTNSQVSEKYTELLRRIVTDELFLQCSKIISFGELQNEAICIAIQSMTRPLHGNPVLEEIPSKQQQERICDIISTNFDDVNSDWLEPVDMIAIRSACSLRSGAELLDYKLIDECLKNTAKAPEHILKSRRSPTRQEGVRDVSRRQGDIIAYTGVRTRLPTDPLIEILPSEWAFMKKNKSAGLDQIFNRSTLVHSKENPHDLIPELKVLVAFILDVSPSFFVRGMPVNVDDLEAEESKLSSVCQAKTLIYSMIFDAAEQVPYDIMEVHSAVYVVSFGSSLNTYATCFNLEEINLGPQTVDRIVKYDHLVPFYFSYSQLHSERERRRTGPWPELSDDPFIFLSSASAAINTYTSVLTVICSQPDRWSEVFRYGIVPLRPVEVGRPAVMLVQPSKSEDNKTFRLRMFSNLTEAAIGHVAQFSQGTDLDARNSFLNMLLGPTSLGKISLQSGQIVLD